MTRWVALKMEHMACAYRCRKPLDEERLKAMPTAKYDAECQAAIEAAQGIETPTL